MTAETKIQIEVIKNRDYLGGIYKGTAMITDGRYIVYVPEKDVIINVSKLRDLSEDGMKRFSPEELMVKMKPALITRKALILSSGLVRCFQCGEEIEVDYDDFNDDRIDDYWPEWEGDTVICDECGAEFRIDKVEVD